MATWPAELQQLLNEQDFTLTSEDTTISTEMDYGPKKKRRRFTDAVEKITCSIDVQSAQYEALRLFYKNTLGSGVESFDFIHPITQESVLVRFTAPPAYTPMGGLYFKASMQWEILP